MKRDQNDATDVEPHVFDQTNGAVDVSEPAGSDPEHGGGTRPDNRTVAGVAMWAANHF